MFRPKLFWERFILGRNLFKFKNSTFENIFQNTFFTSYNEEKFVFRIKSIEETKLDLTLGEPSSRLDC